MDAEELKERTKTFALRTIRMCQDLPKNYIGEVMGKQALRSATSVGANYRAACRARSQAEFSAKLQIVIEEVDESAFWLEVIEESGLLPKERLSDLRKEADELTAIFVSSRKTVTRNLHTKR
ncbi:MAG: four helix bundle protein [Chloroflexi bacterium]|nr:four helix bundle protein [Chloroflexota bacterium]MBI5702576.1 four helix bundle protein [Chloroflexota bacterium]